MHPTVVRDHPDKCPICGMPLSQRKKGANPDEPLPAGVVSRVQLTPWRVALAGIETTAIGYQPLSREITTVGFVEFDERRLARISWRVSGRENRIDKLYANVTGETVKKGDPLALVYSPDLAVTVQNVLDARRSGNKDLERISEQRLELWGIDDAQIQETLRKGESITRLAIRSPINGHVIKKYAVEGDYVEAGNRLYDVADLSSVWIEAQVYEDEIAFLKVGQAVSAVARSFPNREFKGTIAFIHPHLDASTRTLRVRFDMGNPDHELRPGMYATVKLQMAATQLNLLPAEASSEENQSYDKGLVLAVPERAVIDTGSRKIVYREAEPDVFEGVEVQLGPRCGAFYPVLRGLKAGERVATSGSFLIDAETRLTAGAGSTYFGASGGPKELSHSAATARTSTTRDEDDRVQGTLALLSSDDRVLVQAQSHCPILPSNRLGAMGKPVKVLIKGQPVFLCCKGCVDEALAKDKETLEKVAQFKASPRTGRSPAPALAPAEDRREATVKTNLAKLSSEDRRLAELQQFCPQTGRRLGSMGVPVKVVLKGQPVFLCCSGCVEESLAHPDETLAKLKEVKSGGAAPLPQK